MNEEISVFDLASLITKLTNEKVEIIADQQRIRPGKSEVERLICNNSKISKNTQWAPSYTLEKGLLETINWINENLNHYKPEVYNV